MQRSCWQTSAPPCLLACLRPEQPFGWQAGANQCACTNSGCALEMRAHEQESAIVQAQLGLFSAGLSLAGCGPFGLIAQLT